MASERHVVTGEARLSYVHLLKPSTSRSRPDDDPKFSVTVLIPKNDTATMQRIGGAVESAIQAGVEIWKGRPPILALPVYDGDGVRPSDGMPFGAECRGHWVFTASCKADRPPRIVDAQVQDIMDPRKVYSGVYGRVGVDFFPYHNSGKKGVGCALTNVQILRDGEPLGNITTAEDDFGAPQVYQASAYGQQPAYTPPAQQQYQQPAYAPPAQQQYQQPAYQLPQQPAYQLPQQPAYGQSAYVPPAQQQYQQPAYAPPAPGIDPLTGQPWSR